HLPPQLHEQGYNLFLSMDNTTEAHRFISLMQCLTRISRQLIEKEVCQSTVKFKELIMKLFDRIFQMTNILSSDISDDIKTDANYTDYDNIQMKLTSVMLGIVQQRSNTLFQVCIQSN
ncbi:unnamed protein product, partial [Rotaria sp. Silwood1]